MSGSASKRKATSAASAAAGAAKKTRPLSAFFAPTDKAAAAKPAAKPAARPTTRTGKNAFDKTTWVASLTPEQRDLLGLEIETMDESWLGALAGELTKPYFLGLKRFLAEEQARNQVIFPPPGDVYSWSRLTPLDAVRVVILGQDPYHNFNQAHGLAFSVLPPTPPPASLRNIFICLKKEYGDFEVPKTGELTAWARQGVLLLNACLTVRAHNANSHAGRGWETFTERVISLVAESQTRGAVFMAWGTPAGKRVDKIANKGRHCVLRSVHPSPLSASRGFFDCGHFTKANAWLATTYGPAAEIDWRLRAPGPTPLAESSLNVARRPAV
ncbi:uracil-DNA glycosylase-like protein [Dipodascopsis tothii]|uniref:uracil-DNA glycosylase-like protein n=1 Tax=Dipodascopsis tothii TaxID=44089 RepID=UPI0034CF19FE